MKKIVSIALLLIAFGFSANAQSNLKLESETKSKENIKEMAYRNLREISSVVDLTPELKNDFLTLFAMRNEAIANCKTDEEKATVYEQYGKKLLSALNDDQIKKLSQNKELYYRMTDIKYAKQ